MSREYDNYILEHKNNVIKGLGWMADHLNLDPVGITYALDNAASHDESKYGVEEYGPYDAYFYGRGKSYQVVQDFNLAWLHHQHNNPHHWQYWVLVNDDPKDGTVALEMPLEYVYEMIADWWTFSWRSGDLTEIFKWYDEHKERMILHDRTRKIVEKILDEMKTELEKEKTMEEPADESVQV